MKLLGLTGGIGSGKSTVAKIFADLGATIVDADAISRAITAPGGTAIPAIRQNFGDDFIDSAGALNRPQMRALVFSNPQAKKQLEDITHPFIIQGMQEQIQAARTAWTVLDIPLLAESSRFAYWRAQVQWICVVDCSPQTQIERVMKRSQMTAQQVQNIMNQQASRAHRLAIADFVIDNDQCSLDQLRQKVMVIFSKLQ